MLGKRQLELEREMAYVDSRSKELAEIRLAEENGIDVSLIANPDLNYRQMREIRLGAEAGINARAYASASLPAEEMRAVREAMMKRNSVRTVSAF